MKAVNLLPLRIDRELRSAAEGVLTKGESLSSFVEQPIRASVHSRRAQADFLERGSPRGRRPGKAANAIPRLPCWPSLSDARARPRQKPDPSSLDE